MRIISHFSVLQCKFLACCDCVVLLRLASIHCLRLCVHACVKIVFIYYIFLQCRIIQQMSARLVLDWKHILQITCVPHNLMIVHLPRSVFRGGGALRHASSFLTLPFSKKNETDGAKHGCKSRGMGVMHPSQ